MHRLPRELQRKILYYYIEHPVAKIIKEFYTEELQLGPNDHDNFTKVAFDWINIGTLFCDSCRCWIRTDFRMIDDQFYCDECFDEYVATDLDDIFSP
jgi:hypothetical protein